MMRTGRAPQQCVSGYGDALTPGQRTRLPALEIAFLLLASLNYWTDLLRLAFPGTDSASFAYRSIQFFFYGCFLVLLTRDMPALKEMLSRAALLLCFLLLPLVSALWSVNPGETTTRAVALIGSSLYGFYVATQVAPRLALRILAWTGTIAAAISIVLIFAFPSIGLMSEGEYVNVWSGAFVHKNGLGQMTALGALIALILIVTEGVRGNRIIAAGLCLNVFLLVGSRSLTSQVVFAASVILVFTLGRFVRFAFQHTLPLALVLAPLALVAVATLSLDDLFVMLEGVGKNATMSSRIPLWQQLISFIELRPILGWGYEAFFTEENYAYRVIQEKLFFKPYYAHNGYIECLLALGGIGLGMMLYLFLNFAVMAARQLNSSVGNPLFLLCFIYVPAFLIQNTAEATVLQRNSMSWALFVLLFLYLARLSYPTRVSLNERRLAAPRLHVS